MSATLESIETHPSGGAGTPTATRRTPAMPVLVLGAASVAAAATGLAAIDDASAMRVVATGVVIAWAVAAGWIAWLRPPERLALLVGVVGAAGACALLADSRLADGGSDTWEMVRAVAVMGVPAAGLHLALALPDGRLQTRVRQVLAGLGYGAALVAAVSMRDDVDDLERAALAAAGLAAAVGVAGFADRCRRAGAVDRARLQWVGWGVVVASAFALGVWVLEALVSWPQQPGAIALAGTALVPLALALSSSERLAVRIDRLLVATVVAAGLVLMVGAVYLLVVLGLGEAPQNDDERALLGLSMVAAALAAVLVGPVRVRLDEVAHRRVYGERRSPEEALETFGARMSRAVPMEELLLQLAESLKKSMRLAAAEVWTGSNGVYELAASVPDRGTRRLSLSAEELPVVARARVSGNAWLQVWVPALLEARGERIVRVAPVTHSGELLGLIVVERATDGAGFVEDEERVLTELARQVALALHNVQLDSALQASLDELRLQAEELRASRARIVATADQARRQIERNLHDGAQQHLVAMAVKLGLAKQLLDADPSTVGPMLDELRGDAQETLTQLRELAHGIYPPLLMDRGLPEALRAAANRAVLATDVDAEGVGRHDQEAEAAVYFCCLEAMQNAGKHAGEGSRITVRVWESDGSLWFEVADDGAGFDAGSDAMMGHGFMNMTDRLGAIGGTLTVTSAPGEGTKIGGRIPVATS